MISVKLRNKLIIFALLTMLVISVLPLSAVAAEPEDSVDYYGYEALKTLPNSEALLYAYRQLVAGVENCDARITLTKAGQYLTRDEAETVFDAYKRDYAQHFWLGDTYRVSTTYIEPSYLMTKEELPGAKRAFEAAVTEMLGDVDEIEGDFRKELYLHDRLIKSVIYDLTEEYMHSAYGALVLGRAVCDGYTEAFQYLLRRAGIEAFSVYGQGGAENHAWNVVLIDGKYYHVDATWNDQEIYGFHSYFNLATSMIELDHDIWDTEYELPVCDSLEKNYFTVIGGRISNKSECTAELVGDAISAGGGYASFYFDKNMTPDDFASWLNVNIGAVASRAGLSGYVGTCCVGKEVIIIIGDTDSPWFAPVTGVNASATLNVSIGAAKKIAITPTPAGAKQFNIVCTSSDESVATVNAESGLVIGHKKGTARITVKATNENGETVATKICNVTVGCEHESKRHVEAGTSTCKVQANAEHYICELCGQILAADGTTALSEIPKLPLGDHGPKQHFEAGTSTCKVQANAEHYICELCGQILAADGTTALSEIPKLPFAEHDFEKTISEENIKTPGNCGTRTVYFESCSVCGEKDTDATFEGDFGGHSHGTEWRSDENGHWHECICGDRAEASSHPDLDRNGKCDVCEREVAVQTEEQTTTESVNGTEKAPETEVTTDEVTYVDAPEHSSVHGDKEESAPENVTTERSEQTDEQKKETEPSTAGCSGCGCGKSNPSLIIVTLICAAASFAVVRRKK